MGLENGIDIRLRENLDNYEEDIVFWCSFRSLRWDIQDILIANHHCTVDDIDSKVVELSIQDIKDIKTALIKYFKRKYFYDHADCNCSYEELAERLPNDIKALDRLIVMMEKEEIPQNKAVCFYDSY